MNYCLSARINISNIGIALLLSTNENKNMHK